MKMIDMRSLMDIVAGAEPESDDDAPYPALRAALFEKAPPGKKAERFIRRNKAAFKKRYGKNWQSALYGTAWKMFGEDAEPDDRTRSLLSIVEVARGRLDKDALAAGIKATLDDPGFRSWFDGSKATRNGKPLLVYHGTPSDFERFDPRFFLKGSSDDTPETAGFYFTTRGDMAARYAQRTGRVIPAFLRVLRPYRVTGRQWAEGDGLTPLEARQRGHDGYLIDGQEGGKTWIVFDDDAIWQISPSKTRN